MKTIPRIGGIWWPACLVLVVLLLLPMGVSAQEAGAGDEGLQAGEAAGEQAAGEGSVAAGEEAVAPVPGEGEEGAVPVTDEAVPEPEVKYTFVRPDRFRVVDRANDEGGAFALLWTRSPSDEVMRQIADPETGETTETTAYEYWAYHSPNGEPGSWELFETLPTNTQYTWEVPEVFGFLLSELNRGSDEHYLFYEHTYPTTGIYTSSIKSDEEDPNLLHISAGVYDAKCDYDTLKVMCNLRPLGGGKVELSYAPPEPDEQTAPWDNTFEVTASLDLSDVLVTKPYFILFTADVRGQDTAVLEAQPTETDGVKRLDASGGEPEVPDNRDPHWFRLYAVPAGFELQESEELPPDVWMVAEEVGPVIAHANMWNVPRTNTSLWAFFICIAVMTYIFLARGGGKLFIRRIAGLDHVDEAIGRATEMGRPILYLTGLGYMSDIATIASVNILGRVARKVADYESRLLVPSRDPIIMAVCQETVQEAYIDAGRPDAFNEDDIFFLTDDQFAYTAAVDGIMMREKPATNFLMGYFYAESLLLAETGASTGAIQIAGTDALAQLPFFITACDYTLIGEELYAASAYLSREPLLLGSLKGQDLAKLVLMIFLLVGTILVFANIEFIKQLFQTF